MSGNTIPMATSDHQRSPVHPPGGKRRDTKSTPTPKVGISSPPPPANIGKPRLPMSAGAAAANTTETAATSHLPGGPAEQPKSYKDAVKSKPAKPAPPPPRGKARQKVKTEKPVRARGPVIAPRAVRKPKAGDISDDEFGKEVEKEAPELFASLREQDIANDGTGWFSVEMCATPSPDWVKGSKEGGKAPDLDDYQTLKQLTDVLASAAACGSDQSIKLDKLKTQKVEGNSRPSYFFTLESTSAQALLNIQKSQRCSGFKGYQIAFFQPEQSHFGQRFQVSLANLPAPFKNYNMIQWLEVLTSQGWDRDAITHMCRTSRAKPGAAKVMVPSLDIYVKPAFCSSFGQDGCLDTTHGESVVNKPISCPPSSVTFGLNPVLEAEDMITAGYLKGQYFKKPGENPSARPFPQNNGMLETMGENPNVLLDHDLMKTFVRKVIKLGCCQHCWDPEPHGPREICLYKGVCKQCCAVLKNLPFKGFHHSCQSLITSLTDHRKVKTKPQLKRRAPEMGEPTDPTQLVYTQSPAEAKRVKLMAELQKKKAAREAAEKKEADKKADYEEAQKKAAAALEEAMAMEL